MKNTSIRNKISISRDTLYRSLDAVFSIIVLPLATYSDFKSDRQFILMNMALFLSLAVAKVFQAIRAKSNSAPYGLVLEKACACLVSALLLLVLPDRNTAKTVIGIMMTAVLILECILFIGKRRTFSSVLCGSACILTLCTVIKGDYYRVLLYLVIQGFVHIILLSFSQMNLKVLIRIIRKTHAANILAGLLLLIPAASFMIPPLEDSIPNVQEALWYCLGVVTSIGFVDHTAVSTGGRVITAILGLYGLVAVAVLTSIIVNFYLETRNEPDEKQE